MKPTRIACPGFGHEHASIDAIENYLTVISLISDYISNHIMFNYEVMFDIHALATQRR